MLSLTEFLLARIAEDEAVAHQARTDPWRAERDWTTSTEEWTLTTSTTRTVFACCDEDAHEDGRGIGIAARSEVEHIARHDPARVLACCEANRRIVEEHAIKVERGTMEGRYSNGETFLSGYESARCLTCGTLDQTIGCPTLRLLALPYADHEDFQEEWRP